MCCEIKELFLRCFWGVACAGCAIVCWIVIYFLIILFMFINSLKLFISCLAVLGIKFKLVLWNQLFIKYTFLMPGIWNLLIMPAATVDHSQRICEVWACNLDEEMKKIRQVIRKFNYVAMVRYWEYLYSS